MASASTEIRSNQATTRFSRAKLPDAFGIPKWKSEAKYAFLPGGKDHIISLKAPFMP